MKTYREIIEQPDDTEQARDWINDYYVTIDLKNEQIFEKIKDFVFEVLPKKYGTKKQVMKEIRKRYPKFNRKELNDYISALDESRLEKLVGLIYDAIGKWDGGQ